MAHRPHFLDDLVGAPADGKALVISNRADGLLAELLEPAFESAARTRGLLGRPGLADGTALIIAPSNAIHTFFMRFAIDVIYAARDGRVLKIRHGLRPGRISGSWRAFATIEMAAGSAVRCGLEVGDRLAVKARASGETTSSR